LTSKEKEEKEVLSLSLSLSLSLGLSASTLILRVLQLLQESCSWSVCIFCNNAWMVLYQQSFLIMLGCCTSPSSHARILQLMIVWVSFATMLEWWCTDPSSHELGFCNCLTLSSWWLSQSLSFATMLECCCGNHCHAVYLSSRCNN
jgi:hypothetical protein